MTKATTTVHAVMTPITSDVGEHCAPTQQLLKTSYMPVNFNVNVNCDNKLRRRVCRIASVSVSRLQLWFATT